MGGSILCAARRRCVGSRDVRVLAYGLPCTNNKKNSVICVTEFFRSIVLQHSGCLGRHAYVGHHIYQKCHHHGSTGAELAGASLEPEARAAGHGFVFSLKPTSTMMAPWMLIRWTDTMTPSRLPDKNILQHSGKNRTILGNGTDTVYHHASVVVTH